jgi:hypothetical protein
MPSKDDKINLRPGILSPALTARSVPGSLSQAQVVQRDLARYYDSLALALASVELSAGEAGLLVDVLNGTIIDLTVAQMLAAEVEDALADGAAERWQLDGPAFVARLAALTLLQRLAICDAVERFWSARYRIGSTADQLVAVGLVKRP